MHRQPELPLGCGGGGAAALRRVVCHQATTSSAEAAVDVAVISSPSNRALLFRLSRVPSNTNGDDGNNGEASRLCLEPIPGVDAAFVAPPRDWQWCPQKHVSADANCALVAVRSQPVILFDCDPGESGVRATYRSYNAMDELVAPYSLLWSSSEERGGTTTAPLAAPQEHFLAGFSGEHGVGHVRCMDVTREGRSCCVWSYTSPLLMERSKSAVVAHLLPVSPHVVAVGMHGIAHHVELVDTRHRMVCGCLALPSQDKRPWGVSIQSDAVAAASAGSTGISALKGGGGGTCIVSQARSAACAPSAALCEPLFLWDIRKMSRPAASLPSVPRGNVEVVPPAATATSASSTLPCVVSVAASGDRMERLWYGSGAPLGNVMSAALHSEAAALSWVASFNCCVAAFGRQNFPLRDRWEENGEGGGDSRTTKRDRDFAAADCDQHGTSFSDVELEPAGSVRKPALLRVIPLA